MESPTRPRTKQEKSFTSLPPSPRLVVLLVIRISYLLGHPTSLKRVIHHQRVAPLPGPAGSGHGECSRLPRQHGDVERQSHPR